MSTPVITVPLLRQHLNAAYLRRGKRAYENSSVIHFNLVDPLHLRGAVQSEEKEPFEVSISFSDQGIQGDCSCPIGFNCPHVAALLYYLRDQQQAKVEKPVEEEAATATALPAFDRWLHHLNHNDGLTMADDNIYPPSTKQRLLYLVKPTSDGSFALHLQATQQLTAGGYGTLNSFSVDRLFDNRPNFALAVDLSIASLIVAQRNKEHHNHAPLHGEEGRKMLQQAIATERCHYLDHHQPCLTLADTRQGTWQWQQHEQGDQSLQLIVEHDPSIPALPTAPPYYIDPTSHHCGPVDSPCDPTMTSKLLQMPAITAEEQQQTFPQWVKSLPDTIPQPVAVTIEQRLITPTPVLNLYSLAPTPLSPQQTTGGEFFFDYDGRRVHIDDPQPMLSWSEDGVLVRCRRDKSAELHSRSLLVRFGLSHFPIDPHQRQMRMPEWVIATTDDWFAFVTDAIPQLRAEGFTINIEESFRFQAVEVDTWDFSMDSNGVLGSASLTATVDNHESLDLIAAISNWVHEDPDRLSDEALETLTQHEKIHLPMADGRWLVMPTHILHTMLQHMMELFTGHEGISGNQWLAVRQSLEEQHNIRFQQDDLWLEQMKMLADMETIPAATVPQGLRATLRDYQLDGLNWLQFLRQSNLGGILADDMGLGKTVQTLTHILLEKEEGRLTQPALVVAPTSLMHNWKAEAARFTPDLTVLVLHGPNRADHFEHIADYDLVLTTYPLLSRDQAAIQSQHYHLLILDEAQQVKNPRSKAAQMVRIIKANHRLCLTGTPLENHLGELWTQFDFLMPGYLFGQRTFTTLYRRPIEQEGLESRQHQLNLRIRPFMLRRDKSDVVKELPPKTEIIRCVDMDEKQQRLYESVRLTMEKKVRDSVSAIGLERSHLIVLDALLKMRQVCCDPRLLKLQTGTKDAPSAKLDMLCDMLPEMVSEGRHILLFSQFTQMLKLIEKACDTMQIPYTKLTGNTRDRITPIETFQQGKVPLFLISLKAGGTGLNLTTADTVIHYDPWWNPAVEDQATDRAHRIGQDKSVFVYKLITAGTVEEKIVDMQKRKRQLAEGMHEKESGKQPLWSSDELDALFKPLDAV